MPSTVDPFAKVDGTITSVRGAPKKAFANAMKQGLKNPHHYVDGTTISDGTTDARAAILAADADGPTTIPPGTYAIASNMTLTNAYHPDNGAILKPASGVAIAVNGGYVADEVQQIFDLSLGGMIAVTNQGYVTPDHFGIKWDGTDEGVLFNKFLTFLQNNPLPLARLHGTVTTSIPIVWTGGASATKNFELNLIINHDASSDGFDDALLTIDSHDLASFKGKLGIYGTGGPESYNRDVQDALHITSTSRATFERIEVAVFKRHGMLVDSTAGNCSGNNFGNFRADRCGGGYTDSVYVNETTWSNRVNAGDANSSSQTTTIDVARPPETGAKLCKIGTKLHLITAQTSTTITVYPWIISTAGSTGTVQYFDGTGITLRGGDVASQNFDLIDCINCGIAVHSGGLYGSSYNRLLAQYNGVGVLIGLDVPNAHIGETFFKSYFELNDFDIAKLANGTEGVIFSGMSPLSWDLVVTFDPIDGSDNPLPLYQRFVGVTMINGDTVNWLQSNYPRNYAANPTELTIGDTPAQIYSNSQTINLNDDSNRNRLFGYSAVRVLVLGTGANHAPTSPTTFTCESGYTVEGLSNYVVQVAKATEFVCYLIDTDWKIIPVDGSLNDRIYGPAHLLTDWSNTGFTQEADGIVTGETSTKIILLGYQLDQTVEYELEFDVTESTASFGVIVTLTNSSGGGTYYPTETTQGDHTVTQSSSYITSDGKYHTKLTLPADLTEYRLQLLRAHTGTQKLSNITLNVF